MLLTQRLFLILLLTLLPPALTRAEELREIAPRGWVNDLTPIAAGDWNRTRAAHLLERAGFGGTPAEVDSLAVMTPQQAVDYLVDYEAVEEAKLPRFEPSGIYPNQHKLVSLQQVIFPAVLTGYAYGIKATQDGALVYQPTVNEFYTLLISEYAEMARASQWWDQRMLLTHRPLQEKLTFFWHDHFATSQEKVLNYELMLQQVETLRSHANGNFRKMLVAVAQDPAMLIWLDNRENTKGHPNENFAREVMELFTLGEGKGYSEHDIREIARAFTGWTLKPIWSVKDDVKLVDDPKLHDDGEKSFLNQTGKFNGYDAIDIILKQPAAPKFLSRKLYRFFVREELSPEVNDKLAALLAGSEYDLKPLLKTIFLSHDFYSDSSRGTQIKSPIHFVVSTYRKLGLQTMPGVPGYGDTTGALGQMLFFPPNVAGWAGGRSWINPVTLLARGNFIHTLLFPDPESYGAPDKVVAEGYRKIPVMFPEYHIVPHVWNTKVQHMRPVSLVEYDKYLAGIDSGSVKSMGAAERSADKVSAAKPSDDRQPVGEPTMMASGKQGKSMMSEVANGEKYNLALGVYTGFVEAGNRVKPIVRTTAEIDFTAMIRDAKVSNAEDVVDYFAHRFMSVELHPDRRAAIVSFLKNELSSDSLDYANKNVADALRRTVHLILSAPEYQLE